jgi:hypothetical protein
LKYSNGSKFFIENGRNGLGTEIPGAYGKLFLTLFLGGGCGIDIGCGFCRKKTQF